MLDHRKPDEKVGCRGHAEIDPECGVFGQNKCASCRDAGLSRKPYRVVARYEQVAFQGLHLVCRIRKFHPVSIVTQVVAWNDPSAYGYPGWVDVSQQTEDAWQTLTNNALAFRDQLGTVNGQLQGAFDQINNMLGVASFTVGVDAAAMNALRNQANDLLDKYNREMAFVKWESDPKSLLPEVGLLGPFGGGMTFGILAIVGNIPAKAAL